MSVLVITGISRGIGKATTEVFLEKGWLVIGGSQSGKAPFEHPRLFYQKLDVTDSKDIDRFKEFVKKQAQQIDVLVNNAGILLEKGSDFSLEVFQTTMAVNVTGLVDVTEKLLSLISDGGHIVNLSSGLGSIDGTTNGDYPSYRVSKAAVNMYTRVLAGRLVNKIKVSSIDPGWVRTDMGGANAARDPREPAEEIYQLAISNQESGFFWYRGKKQAW